MSQIIKTKFHGTSSTYMRRHGLLIRVVSRKTNDILDSLEICKKRFFRMQEKKESVYNRITGKHHTPQSNYHYELAKKVEKWGNRFWDGGEEKQAVLCFVWATYLYDVAAWPGVSDLAEERRCPFREINFLGAV